ncbi:MAG: peptide-methionine (R)-S-oxide reductase MsrB [Verrucomicrobiota bacterium]|jgi:peptide-methionine (R)-S-oxide reductase
MNSVLRLVALTGLLGLAGGCQPSPPPPALSAPPMNPKPAPASAPASGPSTAPAKVTRTEEEWRRQLSPEQYRVLRQAGTERPFGAAYDEFKKQGVGTYACAGCDAVLFSSREKFDSHCGWPSFYDPANATNVITKDDYSVGMVRTEVLCAVCGGHLGHVFKGEGFPTPTDKRYCINGVSLKFIPATGEGKPAKP